MNKKLLGIGIVVASCFVAINCAEEVEDNELSCVDNVCIIVGGPAPSGPYSPPPPPPPPCSPSWCP